MKSIGIFVLMFLVAPGKSAHAQSADTLTYPYKITGIVRDNNGNPLAGANVLSPGDANMQISDINGNYYAYIYSPTTSVVFSYYRYTSVQYCPDGRTRVDIVLSPKKLLQLRRKRKG
ncbi:MAG TPA: hypothetical protein VGD65_17320, partial [Chryseosolibacter sp.]